MGERGGELGWESMCREQGLLKRLCGGVAGGEQGRGSMGFKLKRFI